MTQRPLETHAVVNQFPPFADVNLLTSAAALPAMTPARAEPCATARLAHAHPSLHGDSAAIRALLELTLP